MPVFKTTITVTVLGEFDAIGDADSFFSNASMDRVLQEMEEGDLIGQSHVGETVEVPQSALQAELLAIGNDGEFFDFLEMDE